MMNHRYYSLCVVASSLLLLPGCEREHVALDDLESRIEELETSFASVKKTAAQLRRDLVVITDTRAKLDDEYNADRAETAKMVADREALLQTFETYRTEYHEAIIKRATGMDLGELVIGAVTYHAARVKGLDPWEVSLQHNAGVTRVDLEDLPDNLKTLFGYDPTVGPKPEAPVALAAPIPITGGEKAKVASADTAKPVAAAPPLSSLPTATQCTSTSRGSANTLSLRASGLTSRDAGSEMIVRFSGVGMNGKMSGGGSGGSSSGSHVSGGKSPVPSNYKPIGSNYSGTIMDQRYKSNDK